jgi:hypothetical protein
MINVSRDEVRLAGVIERLSGKWHFASATTASNSQPLPVDVAATNEELVLGGWRLDDFVGISPGDPRVPRVENLPQATRPVKPEQMAVILLCGGLGTRSEGKIHPLLLVGDPGILHTRTLLNLQLDRLANSPLAGATLLVLGSLLNETALRQHLKGLPIARRSRLYTGGLVPRLAPSQIASAPSILYRDQSGHPSYNPAGHLDALRWLIVSGMLTDLHDVEVILIVSFSNCGRVFTVEALSLAAHTAEHGRQDSEVLFVVEVVARPKNKQTGSMLVTRADTPHELRLVKYKYGRGEPRLSDGDSVLMSANTLYFSVASLFQRLCRACPSVGLPASREALVRLLQDVTAGQRRVEACALFDAAFPVEPLLTLKRTAEGAEVLQAERDLDQLSLLPRPFSLQAVEVGAERAVSIKIPADLEDPAKQAYLFGDG